MAILFRTLHMLHWMGVFLFCLMGSHCRTSKHKELKDKIKSKLINTIAMHPSKPLPPDKTNDRQQYQDLVQALLEQMKTFKGICINGHRLPCTAESLAQVFMQSEVKLKVLKPLVAHFKSLVEFPIAQCIKQVKGGKIETYTTQLTFSSTKLGLDIDYQALVSRFIYNNQTIDGRGAPLFKLKCKMVLDIEDHTMKLDEMVVHEMDNGFNIYWFLQDQSKLLEAYAIHPQLIEALKGINQLSQLAARPEQFKKQLSMLKCGSLIYYLYDQAKDNHAAFIKGSFSIEDEGGVLYHAFIQQAKEATKKYFYGRNPQKRRSSHYINSPQQHGLDMALSEDSDPIDILPNNRHHILWGRVHKGAGKKATFFKCETYGLATYFDYLNHAKHLVEYKLKGRKNQNARRETDFPLRLAEVWKTYAKQKKIKGHIEYTVYEVAAWVYKHPKHASSIAFKNLKNNLEKYEKSRGPLYLITGNEFVINQATAEKLLNKLQQKATIPLESATQSI